MVGAAGCGLVGAGGELGLRPSWLALHARSLRRLRKKVRVRVRVLCINSYYTICIKFVQKHTVYESYYTICIIIVWIRLYEFVQKPHHVRIHSIQFVYNLYIICIQFVYNLYSMKNCIQVGISTGDQYRTCNRRCVCHPPPHLFHQWPFYLYTVQLRKPSEK